VLAALRGGERKSTGKLHGELCAGGAPRGEFEEMLNALARARLAIVEDASFEKDGRRIPYRTVKLTAEGRARDTQAALNLAFKEALARTPARRRKSKAAAAPTPPQPAREKRARPARPASGQLAEALRAWRLSEAKKRGVPAFRICSDQVLRGIAERRPESAADLLAIPGIGIKFIENYARHVYRILGQVKE
jgi:DNA topoisomerase-3